MPYERRKPTQSNYDNDKFFNAVAQKRRKMYSSLLAFYEQIEARTCICKTTREKIKQFLETLQKGCTKRAEQIAQAKRSVPGRPLQGLRKSFNPSYTKACISILHNGIPKWRKKYTKSG